MPGTSFFSAIEAVHAAVNVQTSLGSVAREENAAQAGFFPAPVAALCLLLAAAGARADLLNPTAWSAF